MTSKDSKGNKPSESNQERIDRFDRAVIGNYLIPIIVSIVTTVILLSIFYSAK